MKTLAERWDAKVDRTGGCWLWTGAANERGYGLIRVGGRGSQMRGAHRVAYELHIGPIHSGLEIDHLCRVTSCVNPAHLEAVTPAENTKRALDSPSGINARKTSCVRGHEFTEENTYEWRGHRHCRACAHLRKGTAA